MEKPLLLGAAPKCDETGLPGRGGRLDSHQTRVTIRNDESVAGVWSWSWSRSCQLRQDTLHQETLTVSNQGSHWPIILVQIH